jgi:hypothetical protein
VASCGLIVNNELKTCISHGSFQNE